MILLLFHMKWKYSKCVLQDRNVSMQVNFIHLEINFTYDTSRNNL